MPKFIIFLPALFFYFTVFAQTSDNGKRQFSIYVFKDRYSLATGDFIESHHVFKVIKIMGHNVIDPYNKGIFDFEKIELYINEEFPQRDASGVLCINIENSFYQHLKDNPTLNEFGIAEQKFIDLATTIRELRPNVKLGLYGLPFRVFYDSQSKWNSNGKFDNILSYFDIIFPSLYVLFPEKQIGKDGSESYLDKNLEWAFEYASRLNKDVVPFVWYLVNPGNEKFGGELLGRREFKSYINFISAYSYNGIKVKGIVWWEPSKSFFNKNVKSASHLPFESVLLEKDYILREYSLPFLNPK